VNTLQDGLTRLAAESREKETRIASQQMGIGKLTEDKRKLIRMLQNAEVDIERHKKAANDAAARTAALEREIANVRKDMLSSEKAKKTVETTNRDRDVK
jgi:hypothetical protein